MYHRVFYFVISLFLSFSITSLTALPSTAKLKFDHNHTYSEIADYLEGLAKAHPSIVRIHKIGKSFQGRDLLVLEITNKSTGEGIEKPGYWIDGNLHSSEAMGVDVCLKTIETLVTKYGKDKFITNLVNTRTVYIMPQLNPDGAEYYLTHPDGVRSVIRPHDSDGDGALDEDPSEDLNRDGYITRMRVKDTTGPMKTSSEDPRLMVRCKEDEKGEWRVYSEGIDNDDDGNYNEDGVGGLDINRNWPAQWQQDWRVLGSGPYALSEMDGLDINRNWPAQGQQRRRVRGSGPYALSESETRSVASFFFSHLNITGMINHHMAGNYLLIPLSYRRPDPATGDIQLILPEDEAIYKVFGDKYKEILDDQEVKPLYSKEKPWRGTFGMMMDWAYDHYGIVSFLPEMGSYVPFCDYDKDGKATKLERLKWNDTEMDKKIFVEWSSYDHPQLGKVEIGGFISKIYNPKYKSYTNLMCNPSPIYEEFLEKHAKWNLYLISMSPLVRIIDVKATPAGEGFFKIEANIQNQGYLASNITQQAIRNKMAKTVKVTISLTGAELVMGKKRVDIGHLPGNRSLPKKVEWLIKTTEAKTPKVVIKAISEKGGTNTEELILNK